MENGGFLDALSSSSGELITLMQVTQSDSKSSSSTNQTKSTEYCIENNKDKLIEVVEEIPRIWSRKFEVIEWKKYVRVDFLLFFGLILWFSLCINDLIHPRPVYTMKKRKKEISENSNCDGWIFEIFSCIKNSVLPNFFETYLFVIFIGIFVYLENHIKKKWLIDSENCGKREPAALVPIYHENDFLFDGFDVPNEIYDQLEYPDELNCIKIEKGKKLEIHPDLYWHWKLFRGIAEITTKIKKRNKKLNKLGLHNSTSRNKESHSIKYELKENLRDKLEPADSYDTYDCEIYRFIKSKKNSSTTAFEEIVDDLKKNKKNYPTWRNDGKINSRIISSSPAFQEFLLRYKKNSANTLTL